MNEIDQTHSGAVPLSRRRMIGLMAASLGTLALGGCRDSPKHSRITETIRQPVAPPSTESTAGLDFPGSSAVKTTMRFRFTRPLAIFPATYIWRAFPRRQPGYYTALFWGNDDGKGDLSTFLWADHGRTADSYYGAHPYPDRPPRGDTHRWEISVERQDFVNGVVVYDRWYTQALRVWADRDGRKRHEFYWDLPRTDTAAVVRRTSPASWGNTPPPAPTLTWGDAPWNPGKEVWSGVLRGIQIYATNLSLWDILGEIDKPMSTRNGRAAAWYLNLDPTPMDIADKSGHGNHPVWVGLERPSLWIP